MQSLRAYESADREELVKLWYLSWHSNDPIFIHPDPVEQWFARWDDGIVPNHNIIVAFDGSSLSGFCAMNVAGRYLSQLFVDPVSQGRGVGSALLDWAKTVCPRGFNLHNLVRNTGSRQFYESHGLKPGLTGRDLLSQLETIEYTWEPGDTALILEACKIEKKG